MDGYGFVQYFGIFSRGLDDYDSIGISVQLGDLDDFLVVADP